MLVETINAIGQTVTGAIRQAAQATGAGFHYLLATAKIESGLNAEIKAPTSSATGLFQFIDQTWLMTMKESGAEFGYGRYADAIEKTSSGRYTVRDPALRAEILNLRRNPAANAAMAGALTQHNAARLKDKIGRDPTDGELYIAHFLGAGGAARLINAAGSDPNAKAAALFPRAAAANRTIFYDNQGGARSVTAVYGTLVTKLAHAMPDPASAQAVAASAVGPSQTGLLLPTRTAAVAPNVAMPPLADAVRSQMFTPSRAGNAERSMAALAPDGPPLAFAGDGSSGFYDLFRTEGRGAVSQTVSELWGARGAAAPTNGAQTNATQTSQAVTPAVAGAAASGANDTRRSQGGGFDLFSTPRPQS